MKKGLLLTILVILFPSFIIAEEIVLTLDEAIAVSLRENRDILLKAEDLKKAKLKLSEAKAGFLPTLNFTGSWTDTRGFYSKDLSQTTTQTTLKQYLYKGAKTINTIRQNQDKIEVAQALLDKTRLETVLNVEKAFYAQLVAWEFADLNKAIAENTRSHLDFIKALYAQGQASELDLLQIRDSLSSVEQALESSINQAQAAQELLRNPLYLENDFVVRPQGVFLYEPKEVAYDEAFLKAMSKRPEIRQYEKQLAADKRSVEIAKSDNRPSIYASWDYYSRSTSSLSFSPSKGWQDYNIIGLTFSWPIFDGWATRSKVEQAIVDLRQTQLSKEKTIKDIALELKNAYLDLKSALAKIKAIEAEVELYKNTLSATEEKYRQGIVSSLNLEDVKLAAKVALFNQRMSIYDYIIAKARFIKATGGT